uniref:Protein kinase domain-containing protein n=1 Tax=Coccidioides posadasii RMSCC 3488 TaxID=454284 RepID=A0A0J6F8K5_COCPO|nr:hypothetical protein CPAG_02861 [Coccidioides posadasii RMSCC 3488]
MSDTLLITPQRPGCIAIGQAGEISNFKTWIQSLVAALYRIYSCKVLHQDVKLNNILVDNDLLKIADFANGAIFPPNTDMETIYTQDPLSQVDLLGIGCIIYSIAAWTPYSYDYY